MANDGRGQQRPAGGEDSGVPLNDLAAAQAKIPLEQRLALARKPWLPAAPGGPPDADSIAHEVILKVIVRDAEARVRQALAETLAENPAAPRDVVLALAKDVDLVAAPVLLLSEVLTSDDLVNILDNLTTDVKMSAIARRATVQPKVCLALIERGNETTAELLLRNAGAEIPEPGLHRIVDRHGDREPVQNGLIDRVALPATIIERVVALVSVELLTRMIARHRLPANVAAKVVLETRDRATLGLASGLTADAMNKLVHQLFAEKRLTQSLLLRSLCTGNLEFVMHAIAARTMLSLDYVHRQFLDSVPDELETLWRRADLPAKLLPIAKSAIAVLLQTQADGAKWDATYLRRRITQRMITGADPLAIEFSAEDIEYLVTGAADGGAGPQDFNQIAGAGWNA